MLTISGISGELANTTTDPTTIYVLIGIGILFFLILASAGTAGKTRVKKYCPYCRRQINYSALPIRPERKYQPSSSPQKKVNTQRSSSRPKLVIPRENAPVVRRGGKIYCPYCKGQL